MSKRGDLILKLNSITYSSTIGVVAPASCEYDDIIDENLLEFQELGFNIKKGQFLYDKFGYLSGSDKNRSEDLMNMFLDKTIDAIVCLRGGYGSMRIIPYLDFKLIKKNPKPFCGYSDITILLNLLSQKCGFTTFHGPMITSNFKDSLTQKYFINILTNCTKNICYDLKSLSNGEIKILNKRNFKGKLFGGNLSILCSMLGTPYDIDVDDSILFIEEVNEPPYVIDRLLTQFISSNKLKKCVAILLGNFTNCSTSNKFNFNIEEIIYQKLTKLNIPIILNFPAGHSYPNLMLPIGAKLKFDSDNSILQVDSSIFH